jgi:two-component system response regulator DegU
VGAPPTLETFPKGITYRGISVRIAIVDDQAGFRKSIRTILEKEPGLTIVAEAKNGLDAIGVVIEHKPDVVLVGISKPSLNGLDATKVIRSRFPKIRIISLSMHSETPTTAVSCQAGACDYICKDCSPNEIIAAIRDGHQTP